MTSRLKEKYQEEVISYLMDKFGYKNVMQDSRKKHLEILKDAESILAKAICKYFEKWDPEKAKDNPKALESAVNDLTIITGQKPIITKAKKSIANFKLREGHAIGTKVTLRGEKMYEFADRLINLALPRVRDFRGVNPNAFDGRGNYALGIKEQLIFPEVEYDKVDKVRGMDIIFVTTAKTDEEARELLTLFNMPFAK